MSKPVSMAIVILFLVIVGLSVFLIFEEQPKKIACTEEAKICPDGSAVGRTGPNCEFTACPPVNPKKEATTAGINQAITIQGISLAPFEILEDSRCPVDVTCVWAGAVKLRVKLESEGNAQEASLTLDSPITFAGKRLELTSVLPVKNSKQTIKSEDYRFGFSVKSITPVGAGILAGQMTIGPICPVERPDISCLPTPEMFAARKVFVYTLDKKTLIATLTPNSEGKFSASLSVGTYFVDMAHTQGPGGITGVPVTIKIENGITTMLAIDVDTGIR